MKRALPFPKHVIIDYMVKNPCSDMRCSTMAIKFDCSRATIIKCANKAGFVFKTQKQRTLERCISDGLEPSVPVSVIVTRFNVKANTAKWIYDQLLSCAHKQKINYLSIPW